MSALKRMILIGPVSCGKTTLCRALNHMEAQYRKTQAIEAVNQTLDTPGEYLEHRNYYKALIVTAAQAEVIVLVQDCADRRTLFPAGFSQMFCGKPAIGVISKTDLAKTREEIDFAAKRLRLAGANPLFEVSRDDEASIGALRDYLEARPNA